MSTQAMLPGNPDGAGLRALFSLLFDEDNALTGIEFIEGAIKNAVTMEINLPPVCGLQKTEPASTVDAGNLGERRRRMRLDVATHALDLVLETTARPLERIVYGEGWIGEPLVLDGGAVDCDLAAIR
jgi:hypothetical protein